MRGYVVANLDSLFPAPKCFPQICADFNKKLNPISLYRYGTDKLSTLLVQHYGCRRTSEKLLFALDELVLPASSFLIPDKSGIYP